MYVRWQERFRRGRKFGWSGQGEFSWSAVLVENVRVDGAPRQSHIAYLAGFSESQIAVPAQRCYLWIDIEKRLASLGRRIPRAERPQIIAALSKKLGPPPTERERAAVKRRAAEIMKSFKRATS